MKRNLLTKAAALLAILMVLAAGTVFAGGSSEKSASGKQELNFWYHSGDPETDAFFEGFLADLNASQDQYEVVYTSFNFADFQNQFQMAVMTDTMPDVVSLGFSNLAMFTAQDSILALDDYLDQITTYENIDEQLLHGMRKIGNGVLYGIPFAYNQEVAWYNTQRLAEWGIEAPKTQAEFLQYCEEFADPANSRYFASMRCVRPYDSLIAWLWTWTDGLGYNGSWFDDEGKCILRDPAFAEALNAYADIYKNGWVSGDSVNNNFDHRDDTPPQPWRG